MVEIKTAARPYAKALFKSASETNLFVNWSAFLQAASMVMKEHSSCHLLLSPNLDEARKFHLVVELVVEISKKTPEFHSNLTFLHETQVVNFINVLIVNRKLALLSEIFIQFEVLRLESQNVIHAQIISAFSVTSEQSQSIIYALEKRFNKKIDVSITIDSNLIGGAIIKVDSLVIDGSVKGQLAKLENALL